jgi:hypothetical protein
MFTLGFALAAGALIAVALWSSQRGEGSTVTGAGNAFDAYYGKKKDTKKGHEPCAECIRLGCIGAGECRCQCHQTVRVGRGLEA